MNRTRGNGGNEGSDWCLHRGAAEGHSRAGHGHRLVGRRRPLDCHIFRQRARRNRVISLSHFGQVCCGYFPCTVVVHSRSTHRSQGGADGVGSVPRVADIEGPRFFVPVPRLIPRPCIVFGGLPSFPFCCCSPRRRLHRSPFPPRWWSGPFPTMPSSFRTRWAGPVSRSNTPAPERCSPRAARRATRAAPTRSCGSPASGARPLTTCPARPSTKRPLPWPSRPASASPLRAHSTIRRRHRRPRKRCFSCRGRTSRATALRSPCTASSWRC